MATWKQVMKSVEDYGCTVDNHDSARCISRYVDAPKGKVWTANGCHQITLFCYRGHLPSLLETYDDVLEQMEYGLSDCDDLSCDNCIENT